MPAVSKAQSRFFRWAEHNPAQAKEEGKGVGMTKEQMHDFATTPEKGLPERASNGGALSRAAKKMHLGS